MERERACVCVRVNERRGKEMSVYCQWGFGIPKLWQSQNDWHLCLCLRRRGRRWRKTNVLKGRERKKKQTDRWRQGWRRRCWGIKQENNRTDNREQPKLADLPTSANPLSFIVKTSNNFQLSLSLSQTLSLSITLAEIVRKQSERVNLSRAYPFISVCLCLALTCHYNNCHNPIYNMPQNKFLLDKKRGEGKDNKSGFKKIRLWIGQWCGLIMVPSCR